MPARLQDKVAVACPKCGHTQKEPPGAYSTMCRKCHAHFRLADLNKSAPVVSRSKIECKEVVCFGCGTILEVPLTAESTMCKRCSQHLDLRDYEINQAVSKNFRTHGRFIIGPKGNVFNTKAKVQEAEIRGKFMGDLFVQRSLTVYSTAEIKGTFRAGGIVVPKRNHFRWPELTVETAEIEGELVASFRGSGTIRIRSTGCLFGDVEARNLVIEPGAVWEGHACITGHHKKK